jgi:hypothetical protein
MSIDTSRTTRVEARIAPDVLAVVRRAAEIEGRSVSDFLVGAAQESMDKRMICACPWMSNSALHRCCWIPLPWLQP